MRKRFFIFGLFLVAASVSSFGSPLFLTVSNTPYDRQMSRVSATLNTRGTPAPVTLPVTQWMTELRAMPYHYSKFWQTPAEVDSAHVGDCKGKALVLYEKMRRNGARNLRLVIGKHHIYDSVTHAWLEWETTTGPLLLDPTFNEAPIRATQIDPMVYLPLYAYDGMQKYSVTNIGLVTSSARVAAGVSNHTRGAAINPVRLTGLGSKPVSLPGSSYIPASGTASSAGGTSLTASSVTPPARPWLGGVRASDHCGFRRLNR